MATHEIIIHQNTGATAEQAPYLGNYVTKDTVGLDALAAEIAVESGLPAIQTRAILEGQFESVAELERESLVRANFDGFAVCGVIMGSLPTSDAGFDPARNRFVLAIRLDDSLRLALANVTPSIVTDATVKRVSIRDVSDIAQPRPYGVVHGQRQFLATGYNLILTDEGAELFMQDRNGTRYELVVDEANDPQKIKAHTATLLEPGDYKVVIKSRGGDAEGGLQTRTRKVKYLKTSDPAPRTITGVSQEGYEPNEIDFSPTKPVVLTGENLADVQSVKILGYPQGYDHEPDEDMELNELEQLASTETTISFLNAENTAALPDGSFWGKPGRIVCTWEDDTTATADVTFHEYQ